MQLGRKMACEDLAIVEPQRGAMLPTHSHVRQLMLLVVVEPQAVPCDLCPARHAFSLPNGLIWKNLDQGWDKTSFAVVVAPSPAKEPGFCYPAGRSLDSAALVGVRSSLDYGRRR